MFFIMGKMMSCINNLDFGLQIEYSNKAIAIPTSEALRIKLAPGQCINLKNNPIKRIRTTIEYEIFLSIIIYFSLYNEILIKRYKF